MGGPTTYLDNFTHALIGTVKHYAAYGMSAGGIDGSPADVSEQVAVACSGRDSKRWAAEVSLTQEYH